MELRIRARQDRTWDSFIVQVSRTPLPQTKKAGEARLNLT